MDRNRVGRPGPAWDAMVVVSVLYVPMAVLAMGPYLLEDPTILLSPFPEGGVRGFLESALAGRTGPYQAHLAGMISHTLTGSLLLMLGPYLLWSRPRRRTRTHVIAGRVYLATALASMTGALVFLANEPLESAFTGPVFALGLWAMLVGTVSSAVLGWVAALRHQIRLHVIWVCLNYGFLMSAPMLRIEWGLFGAVGVGDTLEEVSPQSAIHIVALTATAGVIGGLHIADHLRPKGAMLGAATSTTGGTAPFAVPRSVVMGCGAVGLVALLVVAERHLDHGSRATTHLAWYVVPVLLVAGACALLRRRALARERLGLADDLVVVLCWLALSPVIALVVAAASRGWLGLTPPVADATGVTLCGGLAAFFAAQTLHVRAELTDRRRAPAPTGAATRSPERAPAS